MAQTQVAVAPPPAAPTPTFVNAASTDSAAIRLLRSDAAARSWLLPPPNCGGGAASQVLSGPSLRAAVALEKRVHVSGGAARDIQLQFLFCPFSSSNGRTLGIVECRSSAQVAAGPGATPTLLPPRSSRFLMDESTREVAVVGWVDSSMASSIARLRSGAVAVVEEGVSPAELSLFTMSFTSDAACARRRRVMLVLASAPTLERLPEVVLHRVDVEEVATAGPVGDGRHADGLPRRDTLEMSTAARGEPPPPMSSPSPLLSQPSPPSSCATPVLRGLAAEASADVSTHLPIELNDELPLPSPLPSPLNSLAEKFSASDASLSSLGACLGLPPPSNSSGSGAGSNLSDNNGPNGAVAVATLPAGTLPHDVATARGGAPAPLPASSCRVGNPDPRAGGHSPSPPSRSRVNAYDFGGFATTLLDLVGGVATPFDPNTLPAPELPVHDYAAAMAVGASPDATVVPTHYGGFCIIRGLGVPGGISSLSHVLSVIRLAPPDVRDALKVSLVQAMLDNAAGTIFRPLGSPGGDCSGGMPGLREEEGLGVVGAWTPRPSLSCLVQGAAMPQSTLLAPPWGDGQAPWHPPLGGAAPPPPGIRSLGVPWSLASAAAAERAAPAAAVAEGGVARRRAANAAAEAAAAKRQRGGGAVADGSGFKAAAAALDPSSAAYRRQVRNRESAARSNEKRRLRRLAAKAEAAAAAAAAATAAAAAANAATGNTTSMADSPPEVAAAAVVGFRGDSQARQAGCPPDSDAELARPDARMPSPPCTTDATAVPTVAVALPD
ncbi:hypothetical protein MMPV_002101 [Pyropia vietnamensis]